MVIFTFVLYAVIGVVIGVMFDGTAGGLIGFASGALIYKFATSLVQFDERDEL